MFVSSDIVYKTKTISYKNIRVITMLLQSRLKLVKAYQLNYNMKNFISLNCKLFLSKQKLLKLLTPRKLQKKMFN